MISATGWPRQLAAFVEKVLVARGAAKAVAIVSELQMYQRALSCMKSTFDALQLSLASIDSDASIWFVVNRQGHIDTLKDCAAAAEEIGWWLAEMLFGDTYLHLFTIVFIVCSQINFFTCGEATQVNGW